MAVAPARCSGLKKKNKKFAFKHETLLLVARLEV